MAMERMLAGLSTRLIRSGWNRSERALSTRPPGTSKSAASRLFVAATETALAEFLAADLTGLDLVAIMVDAWWPWALTSTA
jgi:hypothetical protein